MNEREIVALIEKRERAVNELQQHVDEFRSLDEHHRLLAVVHQICAAILNCEQVELTRDEIVHILEPARTCQAYVLSRAIAQQHCSRMQHQSARIMHTLQANPRQTRIASLACGCCPDLRLIRDQLPDLAGELWLHDSDPAAVQFARGLLRELASRCHFDEGDAISAARRLPRNTFDLVLSADLYDSLDQRKGVLLLQMVYRVLAEGGVFFFTNVAKGNPYRPLIEYFGDWKVVERSEEDLYQLCETAGIGRGNVRIRPEETGLAFLVEVTRLE